MTDKVHIFYHKRDLDGQCSGAIARYGFLLDDIKPEEIEMWPYDYGEPFPFNQVPDGDAVWMVDVTTNPYETMLRINEKYHLFVLDHHKSFIESDVAKQLRETILEIGTAACELSWKEFIPGEDMPDLVRLLGRYDIWDNADKNLWENKIMPTQMGMRMRMTDPGTEEGFSFWKKYFDDFLDKTERMFPKIDRHYLNVEDEVQKSGKTIIQYQETEDAKAINFYSFEAKFEGLNAICLNSTRFNSQVYKTVWDPDKYDLMLAWVSVKGETCTVSLYTTKDDLDVSEIAKSFGGGGHKQAAGFQCEEVKVITNMNHEKAVVIHRL
jgi:oligoribonuclease NrnB/cAMP/cGMP phosphodiesterase (DHH superfamily)